MTSQKSTKAPNHRKRTKRRNGPGLESRLLAIEILTAVLVNRRGLDDALEQAYSQDRFKALEPRDRGFGRLLAVTVLRNKNNLQAIVDGLLDRPLKASASRANLILLLGAAQLLQLSAPAHAVIDTAVNLCRQHRSTGGFDRLTNAVLRRVDKQETRDRYQTIGATENYPAWMIERWRRAYGSDKVGQIASACLTEAPLDISVKSDPQAWAEKLGGIVTANDSVRRRNDGRIEDLSGYDEGSWWVQDAGAAIPVQLLGNIKGWKIADICAAPGGKTAQLAARGADVVAIDLSQERLRRVEANLIRLQLSADLRTADATDWSNDAAGMEFDAVLVDAPCTASGTIRRHPDILHLKQADDVRKLAKTQSQILANAAGLVRSGGTLVYCTCSLEPEECEVQVEEFLAQNSSFVRSPVQAIEFDGLEEFITQAGDIRTLPFHWSDYEDGLRGIDGFYASRLLKI